MMKKMTRGPSAKLYNQLIDFLPRQRIQSNSEIFASHTPRGQHVRVRAPRQNYSKSVEQLNPFQIILKDEFKIYYGTVNGQQVFPYPFYTFTLTGDATRVSVMWSADFNGMQSGDYGSFGVTDTQIVVEAASQPFQQEVISNTTIICKAIIGFVLVADGKPAIQQVLRGHLPAYIGG